MQPLLDLLNNLNKNDFWLFLASLASILGFLIIFTPLTRKVKRPLYAIRSFNIVKNTKGDFNKLKIYYNGSLANCLTVSKIAFWNSGRETINISDVAPRAPPKIISKGNYKLLDANVVYSKNYVNAFDISVNFDESSQVITDVKICFDYLDRTEGGVIRIVHTGKSSKDIEILGTLKGVGKTQNFSKYRASFNILSSIYSFFILVSMTIIPFYILAFSSIELSRAVMFITVFLTLLAGVVSSNIASSDWLIQKIMAMSTELDKALNDEF